MREVFPLPVLPQIPIFSPALMDSETCFKTRSSRLQKELKVNGTLAWLYLFVVNLLVSRGQIVKFDGAR
jgi:hypothetical protein